MGNIRIVIMIIAMIGPLMASGAFAQTAAPDLHSPWGDDSDVLAPAGDAPAQAFGQGSAGPAGLQGSPGAQSPPSPEDELRAVEEAQKNAPGAKPKEYDLAPASASSAPPPPGMTGTPGVMPGRTPFPASVSPPRSVQRPPGRSANSGAQAPLPVYLHIRELGGN